MPLASFANNLAWDALPDPAAQARPFSASVAFLNGSQGSYTRTDDVRTTEAGATSSAGGSSGKAGTQQQQGCTFRAGECDAAIYEIPLGDLSQWDLNPAFHEKMTQVAAREGWWEVVERVPAPHGRGALRFTTNLGPRHSAIIMATVAAGYGPPTSVRYGGYYPIHPEGGEEYELATVVQWGSDGDPYRVRIIEFEEQPVIIVEEVGLVPLWLPLVSRVVTTRPELPSHTALYEAVIGNWHLSGGAPVAPGSRAERQDEEAWAGLCAEALGRVILIRFPEARGRVWRRLGAHPHARPVSEAAQNLVVGEVPVDAVLRDYHVDRIRESDVAPKGGERAEFRLLEQSYDLRFSGTAAPAARHLSLSALRLSLVFGVVPQIVRDGEYIEYRWHRESVSAARPDPVYGTRMSTQGGCQWAHGSPTGTDDVKPTGKTAGKQKAPSPPANQVAAEVRKQLKLALKAAPSSRKQGQQTKPGGQRPVKSVRDPAISPLIVSGAGAYSMRDLGRAIRRVGSSVLSTAGKAGLKALSAAVTAETGSPMLGQLVEKAVHAGGEGLMHLISGGQFEGSGGYVRIGVPHNIADMSTVPMGEMGPLELEFSFTDALGGFTMPANNVTVTRTVVLSATAASIFPQGSCMTPCGQYWKLRQMIVIFKSGISQYQTGTVGSIIMAHSSNADATLPQTRRGQMSLEGAAYGTPLDKVIMLGVECEDDEMSTKWLAVDYAASTDPDLAAHGALVITATGGSATASAEVGQLWCTYTIRLMRAAPSTTRDARAHYVRTSASGAAPFGTTTTSTYYKNMVVTLASGVIVISGLLNGDVVRYETFYVGTAASYASPTITYTNGTGMNVLNNYVSSSVGPSVGVSSAAVPVLSCVQFTGGLGDSLTITWSGATLPTSATVDVIITVIGNGLATSQL